LLNADCRPISVGPAEAARAESPPQGSR
jgi:hypothetical protein